MTDDYAEFRSIGDRTLERHLPAIPVEWLLVDCPDGIHQRVCFAIRLIDRAVCSDASSNRCPAWPTLVRIMHAYVRLGEALELTDSHPAWRAFRAIHRGHRGELEFAGKQGETYHRIAALLAFERLYVYFPVGAGFGRSLLQNLLGNGVRYVDIVDIDTEAYAAEMVRRWRRTEGRQLPSFRFDLDWSDLLVRCRDEVDGETWAESAPLAVSGEAVGFEAKQRKETPYLGIRLDHENRTVSREGYDKSVNFTKAKSLWKLLVALIEKRGGSIDDDVRQSFVCNKNALAGRASKLRDRLIPLEVTVNNYRLCNKPREGNQK